MTMLDIEVPIEARTRLETTDDREEDMRRITVMDPRVDRMMVTGIKVCHITCVCALISPLVRRPPGLFYS